MPCIYLAQHEPESTDTEIVIVIIVVNIIVIVIILIIIIVIIIIVSIINVDLFTAVSRRPSCLRQPMARLNRLDSFQSQMHRLGLLQVARSKSLQKGLPRKALPLQPQLLPRKRLSQSWGTGEISYMPTRFYRLAPSGCCMVRNESMCVEMQGSCVC